VRVHHLAFRTLDVPRLAAFYRGVLGLELNARAAGADTESSVWLSLGTAILMLERRDPGEPELTAQSKELVAFAISPGERPGFEARLAQAGVAIEQRTAFTLYFRDPDGRRVAVSHFPEPP